MNSQTQVAFPTTQAITDFFFTASLHGYASGKPANPHFIVGLPGAKCYVWSEGDFLYVDCYWVGANGFSWGWTMIWFQSIPVWKMSYEGCSTSKNAMIFLKLCLKSTYQDRNFQGGRGLKTMQEGDLQYFNNWEGTFKDFQGVDHIVEYGPRGGAAQIYQHSFRGMLLIPEVI